jgi:hypothetical protein
MEFGPTSLLAGGKSKRLRSVKALMADLNARE